MYFPACIFSPIQVIIIHVFLKKIMIFLKKIIVFLKKDYGFI